VWLPPMFLGCRPNNFKRYAIVGGVTSPPSVSDYNAAASSGTRRDVTNPCIPGGGNGMRARSCLWHLCSAGCSICPFRPCKYNRRGRTSWV